MPISKIHSRYVYDSRGNPTVEVDIVTEVSPADARRVFADFEQPDLKARFAISVVAPADWAVVSGGAVKSQEEAGDGFLLTTFATTERVSTYLTSVLAGHYTIVDGELETANGTISSSRITRPGEGTGTTSTPAARARPAAFW